jgi:NAD(P)-dependent dehydrogenase (short-subunit alcohol dehydrogenase family)
VSGDSRSIGRSTALASAAAGARVLLRYDAESRAEQTVADIRREGEADKIRAALGLRQ